MNLVFPASCSDSVRGFENLISSMETGVDEVILPRKYIVIFCCSEPLEPDHAAECNVAQVVFAPGIEDVRFLKEQ